jgi:hypothetical protein
MFETLVMADRLSNYATSSGVIVGVGYYYLRYELIGKKRTRKEKLNTVPTASPFLVNICSLREN